MRILALGLLLAGLMLLATVALYARRWSAGRPAAVDWLAGLRRLPRAYLHDVHDVVAREPLAGGMHALTAGGLLASLTMLLLMAWIGWRGVLPGLLLLAALACLIAGALLVARRRYPQKPPRLSGGRFQTLPILLLIFPLAATPIAFAEIGWLPGAADGVPPGQILTALVLLILAGQIAGGPLKHVVAGALHLIVHPRPSRFGAPRPVCDLQPLDLAAPRLGAGAIADFAWNRLVGFDACIQCGRCESACPANAAGQPLNPKALIQDLVAALPSPPAERYRGAPHPPRIGESLGAPVLIAGNGRAVIEPETIWACTSCRACVYECPMMIEHVDAIMALRRHQTLALGATPGKGAEALAEMKAADNPGGRALASRLDWATDLALPRLDEAGSCEVLLWLGDAAFELRGQRSLRSLVRLLRQAKVDFAVLGPAELDCGDLARRLGDEALFQDLARRNIALLARRRFKRILTADPHVLHCLKNEYPALGGHYDVVHHTSFLAELLEAGRLVPRRTLGQAVTYHDPCYLGRYNGEIAAPRAILDRLGAERREMERSGLRSSCCGGGGGAPLTDIAGTRRIPDIRMEHARTTGAQVLAVACPNCAVMLEGVVGPRPQVADIAELLEAAL
jgi:dimethylglycine catabolism B